MALSKTRAAPGRGRQFAGRDWFALAFLFALAFGMHGRFFVTGRVRVGEDLTQVRDPLRTCYVEALHGGRLAIWEPRLNLGTPLFAESQLGQIHPFNLLVFSLLPLHAAHAASNVLLCFLCGAFTFLLAREVGADTFGGAVAGVVFMFSGFYLAHVNHLYTFLLQGAHAPLLLLLAERTVRRRSRFTVWWTAVVVALAVFAGHYQLTMQAILAYVCYGAWRARQEGGTFRRWSRQVAWLAAPLVLGAGLSAVQWMPTWELKSTFPRRTPIQRNYGAVHPWQLVSLVSPYTFSVDSSPRHPGFWKLEHTNPWESFAYTGILPLALIGVAWSHRRSDRPVWPLFAGMGSFLVLALGGSTPVYWLLASGQVGFSFFRAPGRYLFGASLCAAVLAGIGLSSLRAASPETARRWTRTFIVFLVVGAAVAFLIGWGHRYYVGAHGRRMLSGPTTQVFTNVTIRWALGCPALVGSAAAFWWVSSGRRFGRPLAVAVVALDLVVVGLAWERMSLHRARPRELRAAGPLVDHLPPPDDAGRIWFEEETCPVGRGYEIVGQVTPNVPACQELLWSLVPRQGRVRVGLLRAYGVHFVVTRRDIDDAGVRLVYRGRDPLLGVLYGPHASTNVSVYEVLDSAPRAFIVGEAARASLEALLRPSFDPRRCVLLHSYVARGEAGRPASGEGPSTCRVTAPDPTRLIVETETAHDAWLVANHLGYPGWGATMDGRDVPVYLANWLVQAVRLPAGRHRVVFTYNPRSLWLGTRVSLGSCGVLVVLGVGLWLWKRRTDRRPTAGNAA